ncbi:hypothetical protein AJ87_19855 [Rhizobium yanglingense]|nr:hypothetical protein AJ87_19855 [Rhizobium yanglingense]
MALPSIFSRISAKLALMSGLGIFMVVAMLVTGWQTNRMVTASSNLERQQLIISRDLVDAKASVRGMQIGTHELRLARTKDDAAKAADYLRERHHSMIKYLDSAMSALTIQVNRDRVQTIKALAEGYFATAGELAKVIETKLGAANDTGLGDTEENLRSSLLETAGKMTKTLDEGVEVAKGRADQASVDMDAAQSLAQTLNLGVGVLVVVTLPRQPCSEREASPARSAG